MKTPPYALIGSFLAFCEANNMTEAARTLGLSQPALTNHLKNFESYFSKDLFAMQGRRKVLTPFGSDLRDTLKRRFGNLEFDLKALDEKFQTPDQVYLRIAGRPELLNYWAQKLIFPGTLVFKSTDGPSAVEGLLDRRFDLALSSHLAKASQLHGKKIFSDQFCLLIPKSWKMDLSVTISSLIKKLADRPCLAYKEDDPLLKTLSKSAKEVSSFKIGKVVTDWPTIANLVQDQQGWSMIPTRYLEDISQVDHKMIPSSILPETQFYVLYRQELTSMSWFKDILSQFNIAR